MLCSRFSLTQVENGTRKVRAEGMSRKQEKKSGGKEKRRQKYKRRRGEVGRWKEVREKDGLQPDSLRGEGSKSMLVLERNMTVAVIDSSHTFFEVTCLWETASSLMTGKNAEEEALRGWSQAANHPHCDLWHCRAMAIIHLFLNMSICLCVWALKLSIKKRQHAKEVTASTIIGKVPVGALASFFMWNVPSYYSPAKKRLY